MKELVIVSGKGGTGKTSFTASICVLAKKSGRKIVISDCDVDAADMHILLKPKIKERHNFSGSKTAEINLSKCLRCGRCVEVCEFKAINEDFIVDKTFCEGCEFCTRLCPQKAILMKDRFSGVWFISDTEYGPLVHARLEPGEENSGKLVTLIKKKAKEIAEKQNAELIIADGSPGVGCPVISSLSGADVAILITEPTLSGISDMERVYKLINNFNIKTFAVINKYDINENNSKNIENYCASKNIKILGRISFDEKVEKAIEKETPFVEDRESKAAEELIKIWEVLSGEL